MELRDYLRIARAHWLGALLCVVAGLVLAFGWTLLQPKVYSADANGYVASAETGKTDSSSTYLADTLAKSKVKSYVELGSWRSVAEHAIKELGLDVSPESLVGRVSVSNPADTAIIQVEATGPTPEAARDLAGAWVRGMQAEIERLESGEGENGVAAVRLDAADSARLPTSPSSPNVKFALLIGALIGLGVGVGYAFLRYTLDRRVRSPEAVEKETGLTVVGTIPEEKAFTDESRLIPYGGMARTGGKDGYRLHSISEALRELRTNIQFMDVDNPPKAVVVTSSLPGEGKSTTAANLAITMAANGQRVVLIDGDLRRPMLATIFGLPGDVGLTDVLAGRASIEDVAQSVGPHGNLLVVAAGKIPPNPSELLGSRRMHDLVAELKNEAFVIVDAPPLIPVTDPSVLAHNTDGAIVVARVGSTTIDALQKAQNNLDRAGGRALGVVLNRVPTKGPGAAYYGYQYSGDYYGSASEESELPEVLPEPLSPGADETALHPDPARRASGE
ncbi:polysaccharide biosynthesis tyrosine autokinase [Tessaracoccus caeni]|uniref:polysaccharide biosynthesis tyrosine autokinase n=1 Tax=Tessaracoccus caeni TaxID=3031239 RepID=UPI0023D9AD5E|nr:polysaccharide biosynthesis tyrosine autokinase [Tessaracoccus caeni]MDF1487347.1 polysaccharide biosynthesis tyrosine autokinase [Tessaracoccus caeni]